MRVVVPLILLLGVLCLASGVSGRRSHPQGVLSESVEVVQEPHVLVEAEVQINTCTANGRSGLCVEQSTCTGTVVSGKCPRDGATVKCCLTGAAAPAVASTAQTCSSGGRSGVCKDVSTCSGTTVSGLCRGAANIKCCLPAAAAPSAAAPSAAAPAGAHTCSSGGRSGVCKDVSTCSGTTVSGLCPGAANIKCCLPAAGTAPSAATPSRAAAPAASRSFVPNGQSCSSGGQSGHCGDATACGRAGGRTVSGLCRGDASVRCCFLPSSASAASTQAADEAAPAYNSCTVNGLLGRCGPRTACTASNQKVYTGLCPGSSANVCCITNSAAFRAPSAPGTSGSRRSATRPKIVLTTLQRLSETEHLAKWQRFKTLRGKTYATKAQEQQAYLNFRQNRVRIIWLNDNYGQGYVVWASTAPFTDIPAATFARQRTNLRMPAHGSSFLEMEAGSDTEGEGFVDPEWKSPAESGDFATPEWKSFLAVAEAQFNNDLAAETIDRQRADEIDAALFEAEAAVSGAKACTKYGRPGFCRLQYTCRTHMEQVSDDCPSTHRCCLADVDDLADDNEYTNGPVSPRNIVPGHATVTGTFEVDHRSIMQPIKDQGQCGSCWAHAASSVMEAAAALAGRPIQPLSPQWIVDCDRSGQQAQCSGGLPSATFKFAMSNTPATTAEYNYDAKPGPTCLIPQGSSGLRVVATDFAARCQATSDVATHACDNPDEAGLLAALKAHGPIAVTMDASNWQAYDGGILPVRACKHAWESGNHAVTLVGFGEEDGKKFWLIQNSWSARWGEQGFMRIEAMVGQACGIANYANWAQVGAAPADAPAAVTPPQ